MEYRVKRYRCFGISAFVSLILLFPAFIRAQDLSQDPLQNDVFQAGLEGLTGGRYRTVRRKARSLEKQGFSELSLWLQARATMESGNPSDVQELLKEAIASETPKPLLLIEYAYALLSTGEYQEAYQTAEHCLELQNNDPRAYFILGEAEWLRGAFKEAKVHFEKAAYLDESATIEYTEAFFIAEQYHAAGKAAYRLNKLNLARDHFEQARNTFTRHTPSWLGLARLYYETNKDASARQNYCEKVLEYNPNSAEAHLITAYTYFFRWRGFEARKSLEKSLALNEYLLEARAYRSIYFSGNDQFQEALEDADFALSINPHSLPALAAKALWAKNLGKKDVFETLEEQAFLHHSAPGEFYLMLADGLAQRLRLDEAIELYQRGIELQPDLWDLYKGLGRAQLNLGNDQEGKKNLEIAFENDLLRNNLFTRNLLELLRSYKNYERIETPSGRYRILIHKSEVDIMKPYYEEFLERSYQELSHKYLDYEPKLPLIIEAFPQHRDFEVRTVGIEGLPALGACFGQLITLDSPQARPAGTYNWASTLRHELDHVFQLQISNGQCPRWLAEGCSVYEERRCRPEWERHMEEELFRTYVTDKLPRVREFNTWFGDGSRVLFAYYLASIMVEFIVEEYGGYQSVITMIQEFALKKTPDQVFSETLEIDTDAFDQAFRVYVGKKISTLQLLRPIEVEELQDLQEKLEDGEGSTEELVTLARAHYQQGNFSDARIWAGLAQKRGVDTQELNYTLGMLAFSDPRFSVQEQNQKGEAYLSKAINQGLQDFYAYMKMGELYQERGARDATIFYFNKARNAFPTNPQPLIALYGFYRGINDLERAEKIALQLVLLDENNLDIRGWLLERFIGRGDHEAAADMALQMIYVTPYEGLPHKTRAEALRILELYQESIFEWEMLKRVSARSEEQGLRIEGEYYATLEIARTFMEAGEMEKARQSALDAQAIKPSDPRTQAFFEELRGDEREDTYE